MPMEEETESHPTLTRYHNCANNTGMAALRRMGPCQPPWGWVGQDLLPFGANGSSKVALEGELTYSVEVVQSRGIVSVAMAERSSQQASGEGRDRVGSSRPVGFSDDKGVQRDRLARLEKPWMLHQELERGPD